MPSKLDDLYEIPPANHKQRTEAKLDACISELINIPGHSQAINLINKHLLRWRGFRNIWLRKAGYSEVRRFIELHLYSESYLKQSTFAVGDIIRVKEGMNIYGKLCSKRNPVIVLELTSTSKCRELRSKCNFVTQELLVGTIVGKAFHVFQVDARRFEQWFDFDIEAMLRTISKSNKGELE